METQDTGFTEHSKPEDNCLINITNSFQKTPIRGIGDTDSITTVGSQIPPIHLMHIASNHNPVDKENAFEMSHNLGQNQNSKLDRYIKLPQIYKVDNYPMKNSHRNAQIKPMVPATELEVFSGNTHAIGSGIDSDNDGLPTIKESTIHDNSYCTCDDLQTSNSYSEQPRDREHGRNTKNDQAGISGSYINDSYHGRGAHIRSEKSTAWMNGRLQYSSSRLRRCPPDDKCPWFLHDKPMLTLIVVIVVNYLGCLLSARIFIALEGPEQVVNVAIISIAI